MIVSFFHGSAWSDPYVKNTEWSGCTHPFFQWLYGADVFDNGYLLRPATFMEDVKGSLFI